MKYGNLSAAFCLAILLVLNSDVRSQPPATQPSAKLAFPKLGIAIAPLDQDGEGSVMVLSMGLPASNGFADNINVVKQPWQGNLDDYRAQSLKAFDENHLSVISDKKIEPNTLIWEYVGNVGGNALHFYARAVLSNKTVFLITGTAVEHQWKDDSAKLISCVDSFELTPPQ